MVNYLDPAKVTDKKQTKTPPNYSRSGYGCKLPTSWMLKVDNRWYRVYCILYSNAGSEYIKTKNGDLFLGGYQP